MLRATVIAAALVALADAEAQAQGRCLDPPDCLLYDRTRGVKWELGGPCEDIAFQFQDLLDERDAMIADLERRVQDLERELDDRR